MGGRGVERTTREDHPLDEALSRPPRTGPDLRQLQITAESLLSNRHPSVSEPAPARCPRSSSTGSSAPSFSSSSCRRGAQPMRSVSLKATQPVRDPPPSSSISCFWTAPSTGTSHDGARFRLRPARNSGRVARSAHADRAQLGFHAVPVGVSAPSLGLERCSSSLPTFSRPCCLARRSACSSSCAILLCRSCICREEPCGSLGNGAGAPAARRAARTSWRTACSSTSRL